ncbi:MAG: EAL domain-containing protein [Pseudomonadota bacterium]
MNLKNISSRLLLWLVGASILPLVIVSFLLLNAFEQRQINSVNTYLSQVADMKANQINNYINERLLNIQTLAKTMGSNPWLERLTNNYKQFGFTSPEYLTTESLLRANYLPLLEQHYYDLFLISTTGEIVFSLLHESDFATNLFTGPYKETALAEVVHHSLNTLSADISEFRYYQPSNEPASFLAAPVLKQGVLIGVVALQISTEHIYSVISDDTGLGETGEAVVAQRNGNELLFMAPLKFDPDAALSRRTKISSITAGPMKHALRGERGSGIALDYRDEEVIAAWRYLPYLRWGLVVKQDTIEAFAAIEKLREGSLYTLLFLLVIVFVLAWFMGRTIVLPIKVLTKVTSDIASGKLGQRAEVCNDDELGQLARSFNHMTDQLQHSQDKLEERVAQRTASLDKANNSLQHEINERIKAEEQLRLSSTVFKHSSEAILITDAKSRVIDCNQAYTEITGYSLQEIKGHNPNMASSGHHDKAFYQTMWQSINQDGCWTGEIWDRRKNGEIYPKRLSINAVFNNENNVSHYIGVFSDITHIKETEKKLENLAFRDALTGLPNRQLFHDRLSHELNHAHRQNNKVALLFIDLDQFKRVNDTLGHHVGDELLQEVAKRLQSCVRENDTVARLGGDEFTIILADLSSSNTAADTAQKVISTISKAIILHNHELFVGASIGISLYPDDSDKEDILIRNADAAMYHAKDKGRGNFQFFSEDINQRNQQRSQLESSLRRAIKNEEFELYYQPQIDIMTEEIVGSEALIRWNDPYKGLISPLDFIPIAEENGMILEIGTWVFKQACKHLRHCIDLGHKPIRVAINLSAVQFKDDGLIEMIKMAIKQENLSTEWIELEITESAIMENADNAIIILKQLSTLGIRISIDDFGTGYSSLAYLKKFPIDKLKIDREFIKDLPNNNDDVVLTTTMIKLSNSLGIEVLAEGAETKEQIEFLRKQGCHYVQGYYYSKPLTEDDFIAYIAS